MSESRASRIIDTALRSGVALQDLEREIAARRAAWNAGYGVDQNVLAAERSWKALRGTSSRHLNTEHYGIPAEPLEAEKGAFAKLLEREQNFPRTTTDPFDLFFP